MLRSYVAIGLVVLAATGLIAQRVEQNAHGFSKERLHRIGELIDRHIAAKEIPGAVTLVAHRGMVIHFEARGVSDVESKTSDDEGRDLRHRIDDEAGHRHRGADPGRRRAAAADRSRVAVHPAVQGYEGRGEVFGDRRCQS